MKQRKWHKEIKAWADGAEIQERFMTEDIKEIKWRKTLRNPLWDCDDIEFRIKTQKKEPLIISEEPVAIVYSMQDGYVGQMIKKGLPHKTLLYAHFDESQPKEPQYLYVYVNFNGNYELCMSKETKINRAYIGKIKLEETK